MANIKKEPLSINQLHHPYNLNHPKGLPHNKVENDKIKPINKAPHTHAYSGITSIQNGHAHLHFGVTSTPIEKHEGHVHKFYSRTTFEDSHIHYYEGTTSPPIELIDGFHTHSIEIITNKNKDHTHIIKCFTEPSKAN